MQCLDHSELTRYDYVDSEVAVGQGTNGSKYIIKQDKTTMTDALATAKLSIPKSLWFDMVTAKFTYQGLTAGNKQQIETGVQEGITESLTGSLNYMYRKPLLRAVPATASSYGPDFNNC